MPGVVLLDNTVLTNFALVRQAELIFHLWGDRCATTPAVIAEYRMGVTVRDLPLGIWSGLNVLELSPREVAFAESLSLTLGAGERSCLAVAVHRRGLLASDDADARRAARYHGLPVTGTIGILVLAINRGRLSLAGGNSLLASLISSGCRSPVKTLDELLPG